MFHFNSGHFYKEKVKKIHKLTTDADSREVSIQTWLIFHYELEVGF